MRRRFDHLHAELSVALGVAIARYPLWLWLREHGCDPEYLTRSDVLAFCDRDLGEFLHARGAFLPPRQRGALRRRLARFDARSPTPEERLASLTD